MECKKAQIPWIDGNVPIDIFHIKVDESSPHPNSQLDLSYHQHLELEWFNEVDELIEVHLGYNKHSR